jgi:hypothetical protein
MTINKALSAMMLLMAVLLLWQCDSERFTGVNYRAEPIPSEAVIRGQITNVFTGQPIHRAQVTVQERIVETTRDGRFEVPYEIEAEDRLNRPANVQIIAAQYFRLDTSLVIFPGENVLNAALVYAAPIITASSVTDSIVTAEVFDYQGQENLQTVIAVGKYWSDTLRVLSEHPFEMQKIEIIDFNSAKFQTFFPDTVDSSGLLRTTYTIRAVDKDGFQSSRIFEY